MFRLVAVLFSLVVALSAALVVLAMSGHARTTVTWGASALIATLGLAFTAVMILLS